MEKRPSLSIIVLAAIEETQNKNKYDSVRMATAGESGEDHRDLLPKTHCINEFTCTHAGEESGFLLNTDCTQNIADEQFYCVAGTIGASRPKSLHDEYRINGTACAIAVVPPVIPIIKDEDTIDVEDPMIP